MEEAAASARRSKRSKEEKAARKAAKRTRHEVAAPAGDAAAPASPRVGAGATQQDLEAEALQPGEVAAAQQPEQPIDAELQSDLPASSPAWLKEAQLDAKTVHDTACHAGMLDDDTDLVLMYLPATMALHDLHGQTLTLPDAPGDTAQVASTSLEIVREPAQRQSGTCILGARAARVCVMPVAAAFRLQQCLSDVEPEEEPIDDSVLEQLLASEQQPHVAATAEDVSQQGQRKAKKKRKHREKAEQAVGAAVGQVQAAMEGVEAEASQMHGKQSDGKVPKQKRKKAKHDKGD